MINLLTSVDFRSGIISVVEEESPPPPPKTDDKDPFNISNDEYYQAKQQESLIKVATSGTLLQHATPVVELLAPFVPTHIGQIKLRTLHRWHLKRFSRGNLADVTSLHPVHPLQKHMKKKAKVIIDSSQFDANKKEKNLPLNFPAFYSSFERPSVKLPAEAISFSCGHPRM